MEGPALLQALTHAAGAAAAATACTPPTSSRQREATRFRGVTRTSGTNSG